MITSIFLLLNVLLYSFHFAGHLHNIISNVPNWSSGSIEDMNRYTRFYHKGNNAHYFAPVIFISIFTSLITLFLVWNTNGIIRWLIGADLLIVTSVLFAVFRIFRPINLYFESNQYEETILKSNVQKWLLYNNIRFAIVFIGLFFSIWAQLLFSSH